MRKYSYILLFLLALITLTSCQFKLPVLNGEESKKPVPFVTKANKSPLTVEYIESVVRDDELILTFQASHHHHAPIKTNDYEFYWPNYIFDENDLAYQISKFEVLPSLNETENDDDNNIYIQATVKPAPHEDVEALMFPLYIIPSLFEHGYPVYMETEKVEEMKIADITLQNLVVDKEFIQFIIIDEHPEKDVRNISYTYKKVVDGHPVYPIFLREKIHDGKLYVQLQFTDQHTFPLQFIIQRSTVHLPEWKFSLILPIQENK